jgi:glutathione S-transferase
VTDYILHHYDGSPFAHKARLMFGLKGLAWRSVVIPMVMPKPLLMPLTGGYRRTPVLQIGADIYCDTQLIAAELERRHPAPTLFPAGGEGMAAMLTSWADGTLFFPAVNFVMSQIADKMPKVFFDDRAKMFGRPPTDIEKLKAAAPALKAQMGRQIDCIASVLADGRLFLLGDKPGLADLSVSHPLWMVGQSGRRAAAALEPYAAVRAWLERVAAIGTGTRSELDAKEALAIAKAAPRGSYDSSAAADGAPALGARVKIQGEDRVPEPVTGEVVLLRANEIAVRRHDPEAGDVVVHFPRTGFSVRPA